MLDCGIDYFVPVFRLLALCSIGLYRVMKGQLLSDQTQDLVPPKSDEASTRPSALPLPSERYTFHLAFLLRISLEVSWSILHTSAAYLDG